MEAIFKICKLANFPKVEFYIIFLESSGTHTITLKQKLCCYSKCPGSPTIVSFFTGLLAATDEDFINCLLTGLFSKILFNVNAQKQHAHPDRNKPNITNRLHVIQHSHTIKIINVPVIAFLCRTYYNDAITVKHKATCSVSTETHLLRETQKLHDEMKGDD